MTSVFVIAGIGVVGKIVENIVEDNGGAKYIWMIKFATYAACAYVFFDTFNDLVDYVKTTFSNRGWSHW